MKKNKEPCSLLITLRRTLKYSNWSLENHFKALYIIKKKCRIWAKSWPCPLKLFKHKKTRNKLNLLASIFFLQNADVLRLFLCCYERYVIYYTENALHTKKSSKDIWQILIFKILMNANLLKASHACNSTWIF